MEETRVRIEDPVSCGWVWTRNPGEGIPAPSPVPFLALWPHLTLGRLWLGEGGLLPSFPQQNWFPRNALRQVCLHLGTGPHVFQWPSTQLDPYRHSGPCVFSVLNLCTFDMMACVQLGCPMLPMDCGKMVCYFPSDLPILMY